MLKYRNIVQIIDIIILLFLDYLHTDIVHVKFIRHNQNSVYHRHVCNY
jgi:hypothetical protein